MVGTEPGADEDESNGMDERVSTAEMPTAQELKRREMIYSQKTPNKEPQLCGY